MMSWNVRAYDKRQTSYFNCARKTVSQKLKNLNLASSLARLIRFFTLGLSVFLSQRSTYVSGKQGSCRTGWWWSICPMAEPSDESHHNLSALVKLCPTGQSKKVGPKKFRKLENFWNQKKWNVIFKQF